MDDFDLYARFYDLDLGSYDADLLMVEQFALRAGSPILDLACGTGRLLLPLAREGYRLTGVDVSGAMLDVARRKLEAEGLSERVVLVQQDIRRLDLRQSFHLAVCALSSFAHLLTQADQLAALTCAREHLHPGGTLIVDLFNPDLAGMLAAEGQVVLHKTFTDPDTGRQVLKFVTRRVDWAEQVQHITFIVDEVDREGHVRRTVFPFGMRFTFRPEAELLLRLAGLELEATYGSYDLDVYTPDSPNLILVARRPWKEIGK